MTGAGGAEGGEGIMISFDNPEVHSTLLVTVKLYMPEDSPEIVMLVPLFVVEIPPGYLVSVHDPEGRPFNTTLPAGTGQVGTVIVPTPGGFGVEGCA